jgi:hypothetical protein
MALCNPFGELSLESTQQEIKNLIENGADQQTILMAQLLQEMKIMNLHLSHITDQRFLEDDPDVN